MIIKFFKLLINFLILILTIEIYYSLLIKLKFLIIISIFHLPVLD